MAELPLVVVELMANEGTILDWHYATPDEVAAAHPKCGTCEHMVCSDNYNGFHQISYCCNPFSPSIDRQVIAIDYCRHHPRLTETP